MNRTLFGLAALNFLLADVRDGLGPFLGVYLQQRDWSPAEIGAVMTVGGLAGMLATTPAGILVDSTTWKRAVIAVAAIGTVLASLVILFWPNLTVTTISQILTGIAGAAIAPAIAAMTLGLVGQRGFAHQLGRNEAYNHAGNVMAALLAGAFGYFFGLGAVFVVMTAMALGSIAALTAIDASRIDHKVARGLADAQDAPRGGWGVLLTSAPLLILAVAMMLFHLGNAAMLPLLGQALVANHAGDPSAYTGATIIVAQLTMIPAALWAAQVAERRGYWLITLLALIALPVRGVIAALVGGPLGLFPVQILDGVGAGLLGVAVPGLVARILAGTGHVNAGLGAVMTLQGIGAALSPALGGFVAGSLGYASAFIVLGVVATAALLLWIGTRTWTREACGDIPANVPKI